MKQPPSCAAAAHARTDAGTDGATDAGSAARSGAYARREMEVEELAPTAPSAGPLDVPPGPTVGEVVRRALALLLAGTVLVAFTAAATALLLGVTFGAPVTLLLRLQEIFAPA